MAERDAKTPHVFVDIGQGLPNETLLLVCHLVLVALQYLDPANALI